MTTFTLTMIDALGIQDYIFGSNRLRENLGGSQLIYSLTGPWLKDAFAEVEDVGKSHNMQDDGNIDLSKQILPDNDLQAEVIFAGGGNALLLFRENKQAVAFVRALSRKLVEDAPGLEITAAHQDFAWESEPIGGDDLQQSVHKRLIAKLNHTKQQRPTGVALLGQSVTMECNSTGLPAVGYSNFTFGRDRQEPGADLQALSADVLAKVEEHVWRNARERFETLLPAEARLPHFALRDDFDKLGRTEDDQSYIAVVHADGNNMGKRFENIMKQFISAEHNRDCLNALRALSQAVEKAGKEALQNTVTRMVKALTHPDASEEMNQFYKGLQRLSKTELSKLEFNLTQGDSVPVLPFRVIVFGGDDVTFVCDGRMGLPLAAAYLEEWEKASEGLPDWGDSKDGKPQKKPAYACAGVAVVKTHYPFARAYALSERLCKKAKDAVKGGNLDGNASALDWHFALSGLSGTISDIRTREYRPVIENNHEVLEMRPVMIKQALLQPQWRTWENFVDMVAIFKGDTKVSDSGMKQQQVYAARSKVKALRETLRKGPKATRQFLKIYMADSLQSKLPPLSHADPALQETGWGVEQGGQKPQPTMRCAYFDAIEAMDFFLPISPVETTKEPR
ncbi:MAG: hypothetical protein MUD01_05015 [Chloroflexaceae bacterium]|jgi:hypothetical protein|nr:hypothetical protein [Chloroflexaceae bacterium]